MYGRHYVLLLIYFILIFNDFRQTNYLKICQIDLRQILRVGRSTAVHDQSEISFSVPYGTLPWQPISVSLVFLTHGVVSVSGD